MRGMDRIRVFITSDSIANHLGHARTLPNTHLRFSAQAATSRYPSRIGVLQELARTDYFTIIPLKRDKSLERAYPWSAGTRPRFPFTVVRAMTVEVSWR